MLSGCLVGVRGSRGNSEEGHGGGAKFKLDHLGARGPSRSERRRGLDGRRRDPPGGQGEVALARALWTVSASGPLPCCHAPSLANSGPWGRGLRGGPSSRVRRKSRRGNRHISSGSSSSSKLPPRCPRLNALGHCLVDEERCNHGSVWRIHHACGRRLILAQGLETVSQHRVWAAEPCAHR